MKKTLRIDWWTMHRRFLSPFTCVILLWLPFVGCVSAEHKAAARKSQPAVPSPTGGVPSGVPSGAPDQWDVIVINTIGSENPELEAQNKTNFGKLLSSISTTLASHGTMHLALIA